jgi:hypothetical protein
VRQLVGRGARPRSECQGMTPEVIASIGLTGDPATDMARAL